jgi:hypothetical protein
VWSLAELPNCSRDQRCTDAKADDEERANPPAFHEHEPGQRDRHVLCAGDCTHSDWVVERGVGCLGIGIGSKPLLSSET